MTSSVPMTNPLLDPEPCEKYGVLTDDDACDGVAVEWCGGLMLCEKCSRRLRDVIRRIREA